MNRLDSQNKISSVTMGLIIFTNHSMEEKRHDGSTLGIREAREKAIRFVLEEMDEI